MRCSGRGACRGQHEAEKVGAGSSQGLIRRPARQKVTGNGQITRVISTPGAGHQDVVCEMRHRPIVGEGSINMLRLDI